MNVSWQLVAAPATTRGTTRFRAGQRL